MRSEKDLKEYQFLLRELNHNLSNSFGLFKQIPRSLQDLVFTYNRHSLFQSENPDLFYILRNGTWFSVISALRLSGFIPMEIIRYYYKKVSDFNFELVSRPLFKVLNQNFIFLFSGVQQSTGILFPVMYLYDSNLWFFLEEEEDLFATPFYSIYGISQKKSNFKSIAERYADTNTFFVEVEGKQYARDLFVSVSFPKVIYKKTTIIKEVRDA